MPAIIRLHFAPQRDVALALENAPQQGWFLALAALLDAEWAEAMHPGENAPHLEKIARRPYTLSPLYQCGPAPLLAEDRIGDRALRSGRLRAGQPLSLRIALADNARAAELLAYLENHSDQLPSLGPAPVRLARVPTRHSNDPDVLAAEWEQLLEAPAPDRLFLHFTTPVVFLRQGVLEPVPDISRMFAEWSQLWLQHAGILPPHSAECERHPPRITSYELKTQPARLKKGLFIGFRGEMELTWPPGTPETARAAATALAGIADFLGLGVKTTMGLGQVRLRLA